MSVQYDFGEHGISYEEIGSQHLFISVVELNEGRSNLMAVIASDAFTAGLLCKMRANRVYYTVSMADILNAIQRAIRTEEDNDGNRDDDGPD